MRVVVLVSAWSNETLRNLDTGLGFSVVDTFEGVDLYVDIVG